jgi:AAA15 family ATPase/GTPase
MFKEIAINGFRGITELSLKDLRKINIIVGKNNCGKTSILEALFLATNPGNPNLAIRTNQFREINEINENSLRVLFCQQAQNTQIEIVATLNLPNEIRHLTITPIFSSDDFIVSSSEDIHKFNGISLKCCYQSDNKDKKINISKSWLMTKGSEIERQFAESGKVLKALYLSSTLEHKIFGSILHEIIMKKETSQIVEVLAKIDSSIMALSLGIDGTVLVDTGYDRLIPLGAMGNGFIKVLAIIIAIKNFNNGIVFIDEIENGLHHTSQLTLWKAILEASQRFNVQIFATTHSIENLSAVKSAYEKNQHNHHELKVYRIEKKQKNFFVVDYKFENLVTAIENSWEMR